MAIVERGSQEFQPYARLINVLGDQLITDKIVAVMEVIKNSYDADADNVFVRFFNLENQGKKNIKPSQQPYIEIEDDGDGMTKDTILNVWLKPATPDKLERKKNETRYTTKGRIMQGEKGIGRFAIHKLGEDIELYTKAIDNEEVKLTLKFSDYNPDSIDILKDKEKKTYKLLNQVKNNWSINNPPEKLLKPKGTLIKINKLREIWSSDDLAKLVKAKNKIVPPIENTFDADNLKIVKDFDVKIYDDDYEFNPPDLATFEDAFERAHYKMRGSINKYCELDYVYASNYRDVKEKINLFKNKYKIRAISQRFFNKDNVQKRKHPSIGNIKFSFYAFDLSKRDPTIMTKAIEDFVKDNKIYVYRDGIRVYPFGEPDYDWLELDRLRAVVRAGAYFSYNDLIGFVYISQKENPKLKDSTNRQGIMDIDGAYEDFKALMLSVVEIMRLHSQVDKRKGEIDRQKLFKDSSLVFRKAYEELIGILKNSNEVKILDYSKKFINAVEKHFQILNERMTTVEDLAGLGMAVEKASHDSLMMLSKLILNVHDVKSSINNYDRKNLVTFLNEVHETLKLIYEGLQIIQPLYKVSRGNTTNVSVLACANKIKKYFRRDFEKHVTLKINTFEDIKIKTNEGLLLQVMINLIDNAIYWLMEETENKNKEIIIEINGNNKQLIISDNGPGIEKDIEPYIFQEFFSRKPDGRGLGLYIVKELLERINAEIKVINLQNKKLQKGANFLITFARRAK